ncbi:LOW QUALITY PROTEIN: uncharacterized protein LOC125359858 [Perognathus longimembris pacificus]|uniref:LOW QUALITY PROTEIN: uncharacterized protein LOC125359858 n=1 Tax=Perognathus longimembris pacificus TaxID=214514 RepID=UPI0020193B06|nr:LOW QUALITY PROTEIN: uncharacterized protein LOC125359858 [Perognathus longimembris pacificus]
MTSFLVDTGASYLVLTEFQGQTYPAETTIVEIEGKPYKPPKTPPVICLFSGVTFYHSFLVIPHCPIPLLGRDLMARFGASITLCPSQLTEQDNNSASPMISLLMALVDSPEDSLGFPFPASKVDPTMWDTRNPSVAKHYPTIHISLRDHRHFPSQPQYSLSRCSLLGLQPIIQELLRKGLLRPANSPYNTPILVVAKPNAIWKERGLLTTKGTPVINGPYFNKLLEASFLPSAIGIVHCRAHRSDDSFIAEGNNLADETARLLKGVPSAEPPFNTSRYTISHTAFTNLYLNLEILCNVFLFLSPLNRHMSMAKVEHENSSTITELFLMGFSNYPQLKIPFFFLFILVYLAKCLGNTAVIWLSSFFFFFFFFSTVVVLKTLFNFLASRKVISYTFCLVQTYLTLFLESTECFFLAVMALDRYVAIFYTLRYLILMKWSVCVSLASGAWIIGICTSVAPLYFTILPLCGPYTVDYIFCELPILLHMFCADTSLVETMMAIGGAGKGLKLLVPFLFIILSYLRILVAVMRTDSGEGRTRAFSTCAYHLTVVTIYYGTGLIGYLRPKWLYSAEGDKLICVFYAVINPMLNPFIYSLRNKEMKGSMARILERSS